MTVNPINGPDEKDTAEPVPDRETSKPVGTEKETGGRANLVSSTSTTVEPVKKKKKKKKEDKPTLGTSRGVETLFRTSYRVNMELTTLADSKSNIMISINGIIISILLGSIASKIDTNPWLIVPTVVFLVGCVVSMIYAVLAARPRILSRKISLDDVRQNRANILFFGNFVGLTAAEFMEGMTDLIRNTDLVYTNMIRDTYGAGLVLLKKYKLLHSSYTIFMISLIAGVASFVLIFSLIATGVISTEIGP